MAALFISLKNLEVQSIYFVKEEYSSAFAIEDPMLSSLLKDYVMLAVSVRVYIMLMLK